MKDEYTGGPAFPAAHFDLAAHEHGMSLRDYFAAKAMAAMLVSDQYKTESEGDIAQLAYAIAEKMMEMKDEQGS